MRLVALGLLLIASTALARPPIPWAEWDDDTKLTLAQAMVGEADWHQPDHIALAWVLAKRWDIHRRNRKPVPFAEFIRMYSAPLKADTKRARWVKSLPWAPYPTTHYRKRWEQVRKTARQWGAGLFEDPCPQALHWGGTMDRPYGHWFPVNCGRTHNIFYGIRRRNEES